MARTAERVDVGDTVTVRLVVDVRVANGPDPTGPEIVGACLYARNMATTG